MNKKTLIICTVVAATLSLMAFGYVNWNPSEFGQSKSLSMQKVVIKEDLLNRPNKPSEEDLVYHVGSRFTATITKENLHKAISVVDIVPKEAEWAKISFLTMKIAILQDGDEIEVLGDDEILNDAQIKLLQSIDYSTHFYIIARGKRKDGGQEGLKDLDQEEFDLAYYLTVVPEKEAEYATGKDALITYLRENSIAATSIIQEDKIEPGMVNFTITKKGIISNVNLLSTCGYSSVDKTLIDLLSLMPGKWSPGTNSIGEEVDQEFVFFFGRQGC